MREWTTVGVHDNVVEASWLALVDALTYATSAITLSASGRHRGPCRPPECAEPCARVQRGTLRAPTRRDRVNGSTGAQQAELVALGVGEDVPVLLAGLADVGPDGPEIEQALQLGVLVAVGRVDVDVQSQLARGGVGPGPKTSVGAGPPNPASGPISMAPSSRESSR